MALPIQPSSSLMGSSQELLIIIFPHPPPYPVAELGDYLKSNDIISWLTKNSKYTFIFYVLPHQTLFFVN